MGGTTQTNIMFGAILVAFIIYVTVRGQLPQYIDIFKPPPPMKTSNNSTSSDISTAVKIVTDATTVFGF